MDSLLGEGNYFQRLLMLIKGYMCYSKCYNISFTNGMIVQLHIGILVFPTTRAIKTIPVPYLVSELYPRTSVPVSLPLSGSLETWINCHSSFYFPLRSWIVPFPSRLWYWNLWVTMKAIWVCLNGLIFYCF